MSINQRQRGDQGKKEWDGESPSIPPSVALSLSFAFFSCVSFPAPKPSLHLPSLRTTPLAPRLDYFHVFFPFFTSLYSLVFCPHCSFCALCVFSPKTKWRCVFTSSSLLPPSYLFWLQPSPLPLNDSFRPLLSYSLGLPPPPFPSLSLDYFLSRPFNIQDCAHFPSTSVQLFHLHLLTHFSANYPPFFNPPTSCLFSLSRSVCCIAPWRRPSWFSEQPGQQVRLDPVTCGLPWDPPSLAWAWKVCPRSCLPSDRRAGGTNHAGKANIFQALCYELANVLPLWSFTVCSAYENQP